MALDRGRGFSGTLSVIDDGKYRLIMADLMMDDADSRVLLGLCTTASEIARAMLPPAGPDDLGRGVSWSTTFVGPVLDPLAELLARALVVRLIPIVAVIAARKHDLGESF